MKRHEPGCPAMADDESDYEHLVDAGICVCGAEDDGVCIGCGGSDGICTCFDFDEVSSSSFDFDQDDWLW